MSNSSLPLADVLGHEATDKRIDILRRIGEVGSISEAARGAGVSYKAAWQALDSGPVAQLAAQAERGMAVQLTLCGERAFLRQHPGDLAPRQPEVAQHAELASACRGERGKAGGDTGQADDHGDGFKKVGDGEGAVEDAQADGADLAGVG